jgi:hypothetical protein
MLLHPWQASPDLGKVTECYSLQLCERLPFVQFDCVDSFIESWRRNLQCCSTMLMLAGWLH